MVFFAKKKILPSIEFADLHAFVHAATLGGLTRAGDRLGVSKSIISRRLAKLEANLGARLLTRTTHGLSLTEAGMDFLVHAQRILAEAEEARAAVAGRDGELAGQLRLAPVRMKDRGQSVRDPQKSSYFHSLCEIRVRTS